MKTLEKFQQFVEELQQNNSSTYKKTVLAKYATDSDILYYLRFLYDTDITTGISKKKLSKNISKDVAPSLVWEMTPPVFKVLDFIKENNTGRDSDLCTIHNFMRELPIDLAPLFAALITKSVTLGIKATTINKVIPNLVSQFKVMLAEKYFDKPEKLKGKAFAVTTKIDGMRCILLKSDGKTTFWSRQGQQITGMRELEEIANKIFPDNLMLDGELVARMDNPDTYKATMKTARTKDADKLGLKMKVFDCMSAVDFKNNESDVPYFSRRFSLEQLLKPLQEEYSDYFELLPIIYEGSDTTKVQILLDEAVANGEEGIMINILDAPYRFKRTWDLMKVKLFQTYDLEITGYYEGEGKYTGTLGGFIVRYKDGNSVKVGSGIDDELRDLVWTDPKSYLGKIIEVKFFEETSNEKGGKSVRFPIFKDFRDDKDKPDF